MTNTFDENGLSVMTYDEARALIASAITTLPGCSAAGVDNEDTIVGKLSSILAELFADQNELIQFVHACYDPNSSVGVALQRLVLLNGIRADSGSKSTTTLSCTANAAGCTITAGSLVSDPNNQGVQYETDSELVLSPGATDTVTATCTTKGYNTGAAGTLTQIDTPIYGWSTVTNLAAVTPGTNEEASSLLRNRRDQASRRFGLSTLSGVWTALENISDVDSAFVIQNLKNYADEFGLEPRTLKAIVDGGTDADIAETLFEYAPIQTAGDETVIHSYRGHNYTMRFQRPTETSLDIELTFAPLNTNKPPTWPENGEETVKTALLAWLDANQKIGVDAEPKAFAGASAVIEGFYVDLCEIAEHLGAVSENPILADIDEKFISQTDYVTVTVTS